MTGHQVTFPKHQGQDGALKFREDSSFVSTHTDLSAIQYSAPDTTGGSSQQKMSVISWQTLVGIVLEKSYDDERWFECCPLKVHGAIATIVGIAASPIRETRDKADPAIYGQEKRTINT